MRDWFATIALVVLFVVAGIEAIFIKSNADAVNALEAQNQALSASSAQTALQFQTFLKGFTAEANYSCMIASARARIDDLPQPAPGTCSVTAP